MALSKTTQDHEAIRRWAEERGARPAAVTSTETDDSTGIIRLEFPGAPNAKDDSLQEISWDEWFEKFDSSGLEFTFQEKTASGQRSNFNKLTYPTDEKASDSRSSSRGSKTGGSHSSSSKSGSHTGKKNVAAHSEDASSAKSAGRTAGPPSGRASSNRTTGRASSGGAGSRGKSGKAA